MLRLITECVSGVNSALHSWQNTSLVSVRDLLVIHNRTLADCSRRDYECNGSAECAVLGNVPLWFLMGVGRFLTELSKWRLLAL